MDFGNLRIGIGHDTHRLVEGGPLRLGGVDIPFEFQLDGHSDADALLHAVTDALLGAAGLGDIGELFPNDAAENRDRDSSEMLSIATQRVVDDGFRVINADCIVFAEKPKLSAFKEQMCNNVAHCLGIDPSRVGIKAKTGEGVDAVGFRQGDLGPVRRAVIEGLSLTQKWNFQGGSERQARFRN